MASQSTIQAVDLAAETARRRIAQVPQQAVIPVLARAFSPPTKVLKLLR